jgi:molecular chaperone DnaK (HSP70)
VLKDADLEEHDIHEIVMAGGGSKMSLIQRSISNYMNGAALLNHLDPETVIAKGA